jgi:hypothetical protein
MITAVTKCGHEKGSQWTDAISLLQKWGSIIKKKFKDASLEGNNLLGRRSIPDQLEKLNESVAKLLRHRIDAIEQSARNANAIIKHTEEIKSLNTKVSALQEFQKVLVHQNQNLQFRLNELCLHLKVPMADLPEIPVTATNTRAVVEAVMGQPVTMDVVVALLGSLTTGWWTQ